jgi:hypothetical protein
MRWLLLTIVPLITIGSVLFGLCDREPAGSTVAFARALTAQPTTSGCEKPPNLSYTIPSDIAGANSQANVNCLAWQDFIAVNWQASPKKCSADATIPPAKFGEPNSTALVVWETYKEASDVFRKDAAPPSPWCSTEPLTRGNKALGARLTQAGTGGAWLTAQNHRLALYEIRINRDLFGYIEANRLYDATTQESFAKNSGIDLPNGTAEFSQYGKAGAMVFKASWIELPDPSQWPYFKTSKAYVTDPGSDGPPRLVTVGLVGLHIIHKTAKSPQFIWATFEHVNNAPSTADIKNDALRTWYTFYDAQCNPQMDHYRCNANVQPAGNGPAHPTFPRYPADPYDAPVQVVRENSISHTSSTMSPVSINGSGGSFAPAIPTPSSSTISSWMCSGPMRRR